MTVRLTLAALSLVVITKSASAQNCENGICRSPAWSGGRSTENRWQNDSIDHGRLRQEQRVPRGNDGRRVPPHEFGNRVRPAGLWRNTSYPPTSAQACLNCDCDGRLCTCGPNCPPHNGQQRRMDPRSARDLYPTTRTSFDQRYPAPARSRRNVRPVTYRERSVSWHSDFQQAVNVSRRTGRPLLVKVGADWCGYCQRMDRETFTDRELLSRIGDDFITVELDADQNTELMQKMRIRSLPTVLVMTPELRIAQRTEGFQTATQLVQTLQPYMQRADLENEVQLAELR